ncbi:integration host factor, actinobacterial type [Arcanobacterium buesumense]|uniref:Integration host factor MihF n=1 Tax=Arcanobacterium buesumense TaxID=2722751 RepID=A0A6H2EJL4_9ACTO|nr:integration host factor, actinobacterial type [Arcanobacterium buesumense]QJC21758.1 integration host factor MihF [Arcanobacterium buesumense]
MVIPHLTNEQRRAALAKAGLARQRRAEIKQAIKEGSCQLIDVFSAAGEDEAIARMKILDLLLAFPKIGEVKAQSIMEEIGIAASRRIGGLGYRQRASLIELLG